VSSQITDPSRAESAESGYGSVLRNKQFMSLWVAQVFSQLADRAVFVLFVAVLTMVPEGKVAGHTMGAAQMTSLLYVAFTIPAVILSPIAGVYVDRWSNRSVLVWCNFARAFFVALVATPLVKNHPITALTDAALISIGSQFFGPAETASIPRLVKHEDLYCANSLFFTTMMLALGFGFAIGGPILEIRGIEGAPYLIAGGFLLAGLLVMGISDNKRAAETREHWLEELRFGIAYIATNPPVFRAIVKIAVLFSTIITLNIIAVGLAEQVMHIQPFQFGYVIASAGLGMGIGNFWVGHYAKQIRPVLLVWGGFTGLGFFMSLLGCLGYMQDFLFPYVGLQEVSFRGWLMLVPLLFSAFIGFSCALVAVPTQTALQAAVPEEHRGKVFGAQNTAMSAASTIPVVLAGVSADNLPGGVSTTLFLIGLPTLACGLFNLLKSVKDRVTGNV